MINDWKTFLKTQGFEKIDRKDFLRSAMPISAHIYETPLRVGQRGVRLNAAIEIHDPWIFGREYHVIHLRGDVTPEGIYVNYDETPRWLHPDEKDQVCEVIEGCLMDWVKHWSDLHHLIQYFENPVDIVMTRLANDGKYCEHIAGVPAKRRIVPYENYLLSLLYYHTGKFEKALAAAKRYFELYAKDSSNEVEPQRTKRQIEALASKII